MFQYGGPFFAFRRKSKLALRNGWLLLSLQPTSITARPSQLAVVHPILYLPSSPDALSPPLCHPALHCSKSLRTTALGLVTKPWSLDSPNPQVICCDIHLSPLFIHSLIQSTQTMVKSGNVLEKKSLLQPTFILGERVVLAAAAVTAQRTLRT